MPVIDESLEFRFGLSSKFSTITPSVNTLYFLTDTQQLFVGDTEYTRPVQYGTALPDTFMPANSLFVVQDGTARKLYISKDGASWDLVSVLNETITGGVFGDNTAGTISSTFKVPNITVDDRGHVTAIQDTTLKLPAYAAITVGNGNALTGAVWSGNSLQLQKNATFATASEVTELQNQVTALTETVGNITSFELDANQGTGYDDLASLKAAHSEGTAGVFYLVKNPDSTDGNAYLEYFWTGTDYELAGKFGDVDHSIFALSEDVDNALAEKVDTTTKINGQELSGDVNITDITGNAGTATKLAESVKINGVAFDGSEDIDIDLNHSLNEHTDVEIAAVVDGNALVYNGTKWVNKNLTKADLDLSNVDNTADADKSVAEATKATQDGSGNVITETYATKSEVRAATLVWKAI